MAISLMPLPYAENALEPHISANTLRTHHGAHHKGYVDKVNQAIDGTPLASKDLETIVREAHAHGDKVLFNNAAQAWNHGFYWESLTPERTAPDDKLAYAVDRTFGSMQKLNEAIIEEAVGHFASGWAWLVVKDDALAVISTHDAGTALVDSVVPLLTIDVWEHAYYLDVKSKRPDYVKAVVEHHLNWDFANANYVRNSVWRYPDLMLEQRGS
jgi:Fe-Mn family superoxide dismutase